MWIYLTCLVGEYRLPHSILLRSLVTPEGVVLVGNHLYSLQLLLLSLPPPLPLGYPPPPSPCPQSSSSPPPLPSSPTPQTSLHAPSSTPHHSTQATSLASSLHSHPHQLRKSLSPLSSPTMPILVPTHGPALVLMSQDSHYTNSPTRYVSLPSALSFLRRAGQIQLVSREGSCLS